MAMIAVFWAACERESPREELPPRLVVPIKMPIPPKPAAPAREAKDLESPAPPTGREGVRTLEKKERVEKPPAAPRPTPPPPSERGVYRVKKGETLIDIAGRPEVYGDPLRWPVLLRMNAERLAKIASPRLIATSPLPEGVSIRFVTPEEARENRKGLANKHWVVNVLSSQEPERIYRPAVELARHGYRFYLTKGTVKGVEWLRLRVGFFGTREEATLAGEEIRSKVPPLQAWVLRIGEEELEAFGGY
jgi:hypothetical protein